MQAHPIGDDQPTQSGELYGWPPFDWEGRDFPKSDSHADIVDWLQTQIIALRFSRKWSRDHGGWATAAEHCAHMVRNAHHLVRFLKRPGAIGAPEEPAPDEQWNAHDTIKVLESIVDWMAATNRQPAEVTHDLHTAPKAKRSTERGESPAKLIAALTKHHKYDEGSSLNQEPIGNNELARQAEVSESTASTFFNNQFGGHKKYRATCTQVGRLTDALKAMRGEFSPAELSKITLEAFEAGKRFSDE